MKKTVEIEYVGIEDVQEILDDAFAVIQAGNYASIQLNDTCGNPTVYVTVMVGGFDQNHDYDYDCMFCLGEDKKDVATMNECKNFLRNLLREED